MLDAKKDLKTHHYKCESKCGRKARLSTIGFRTFKALTAPHTCVLTHHHIYSLMHWYLRQVAPSTLHLTTTQVVARALLHLNKGHLQEVGPAHLLHRYLNDIRYTMTSEGVSATTMDTLVLTEEQRMDIKNTVKFCLHDDGPTHTERIIIFATEQDLLNLLSCDTWLADGTFSSCPKIFNQLWNIHGQVGNLVLPLVFCFLPNKKGTTYTRALLILKEKLDRLLPSQEHPPKETRGRKKKAPEPSQEDEDSTATIHIPPQPYHTNLVVDFEQAQAKAFMEVFGSHPMAASSITANACTGICRSTRI